MYGCWNVKQMSALAVLCYCPLWRLALAATIDALKVEQVRRLDPEVYEPVCGPVNQTMCDGLLMLWVTKD